MSQSLSPDRRAQSIDAAAIAQEGVLQKIIAALNPLNSEALTPAEDKCEFLGIVYDIIKYSPTSQMINSRQLDKAIDAVTQNLSGLGKVSFTDYRPDAYATWVSNCYQVTDLLLSLQCNDTDAKVRDTASRYFFLLAQEKFPIRTESLLGVITQRRFLEEVPADVQLVKERAGMRTGALNILATRYNAQSEMGISDPVIFARFSHPKLSRYWFEPEMHVSESHADICREFVVQSLIDTPVQDICRSSLTKACRSLHAVEAVPLLLQRLSESFEDGLLRTYDAKEVRSRLCGALPTLCGSSEVEQLMDLWKSPPVPEHHRKEYQKCIESVLSAMPKSEEVMRAFAARVNEPNEQLRHCVFSYFCNLSTFCHQEHRGERILMNLPTVDGLVPIEVDKAREDRAWNSFKRNVVPILAERLPIEPDTNVRKQIASSIAFALYQDDDAAFYKLVTENPDLHKEILFDLRSASARIISDDALDNTKTLLKRLKSVGLYILETNKDPEVQNACCWFFNAYPSEFAIANLTATARTSMASGKTDECRNAIRAIGDTKGQEALDALLDLHKEWCSLPERAAISMYELVSEISQIIRSGSFSDSTAARELLKQLASEDPKNIAAVSGFLALAKSQDLEFFHNTLDSKTGSDDLTAKIIIRELMRIGSPLSIDSISNFYSRTLNPLAFLALAVFSRGSFISEGRREEIINNLSEPQNWPIVTHRNQEIQRGLDGREGLSPFSWGPTAEKNAQIRLGWFILQPSVLEFENDLEREELSKLARIILPALDPKWEHYSGIEKLAQ